MNARYGASSGLDRVSSVPKTWRPDPVGHDNFVVTSANVGVHARKPRLPVQACYDSQTGPA